jgi:hypothetical protein
VLASSDSNVEILTCLPKLRFCIIISKYRIIQSTVIYQFSSPNNNFNKMFGHIYMF